MLKVLSPITFEIFYRCFVRTSTESVWQEHPIKRPMLSKESWQTNSYGISNGISNESTVKLTRSDFSVKDPLLFKLHMRWYWTFVDLKEQFDDTSYGRCLLRLQLANLRATVTHQKRTIIYQNQTFVLMCAIDWSLIGMKQFYMPFTNTQKSV